MGEPSSFRTTATESPAEFHFERRVWIYSSVRSDISLVSSDGEADVVWDEASARNGTCKADPCKALARPRMTAVQMNFMQGSGEVDSWMRD